MLDALAMTCAMVGSLNPRSGSWYRPSRRTEVIASSPFSWPGDRRVPGKNAAKTRTLATRATLRYLTDVDRTGIEEAVISVVGNWPSDRRHKSAARQDDALEFAHALDQMSSGSVVPARPANVAAAPFNFSRPLIRRQVARSGPERPEQLPQVEGGSIGPERATYDVPSEPNPHESEPQ